MLERINLLIGKAMKSVVFLALAGAPLVFSLPGWSEDNTEKRLETVSVTAVQRAQPVEDIAGSVDVLTGTDVDLLSSLNGGGDVTRLLTGVQAAVANGTQIAFQIRGIGAVDHQALTPGAAAVYQDGVFLATNVQTGAMMYDLERVEVLKGPQGTLYGRNASSGAIHFLSHLAGTEAPDYVSAAYGRFDRFDASFGVGGALDDKTDIRLAGRLLSQDATLENVVSVANVTSAPSAAGGKRKEGGLRVSLSRKDVWGGDLVAIGHIELDRGINPTPLNDTLSLGDHQISSDGDGLEQTDNEFFGASLKWTREFGEWTATSLTAIEGYNQQYGFDFDGTPAPYGTYSLNANLSYDRDYLQFSEEVHFQKETSWGYTLIGGQVSIDTFDQDYLIWCGELDSQTLAGSCAYVGTAGRVGPNPASTSEARSLLTKISQDRTTLAAFTHNEVSLTQRLEVVFGTRLTYERLEGDGTGQHIFEDGTIAFNNRDGLGAAVGSNVVEDTRLSGNLALRYELDGIGSLYGSVSNGFKSGGFNGEVQNNVTHWSDAGLFDPETVTAYEIGIKSTQNAHFNWTAAAFYQDYDAPQARIFVSFDLPDGSTIVSNSLSNLDQAKVFGVELNAEWLPVEGLSVSGGVTFLDSEIEQENDLGGNADLFDGKDLPFASKASARLAVGYERRIGEDIIARLDASAKHNGGFFLDAEGRDDRRQKSYTLVDLDIGFQKDGSPWTFGLWGRNLLDEDYALSGYGFIGYNTFRSDPASYGVRLRYELRGYN